MDPREFQELAQRLSQAGGPAELRSATSRAYYAIFNLSAELLNQMVPLSRGAAAHGQVQKLLANSGDADVVRVGSDLGDLHSRRIDADYEMGDLKSENDKTVRATVSEAGEIIATLGRAFSGVGSQAIKRRIQQYWTQTLREPLRGRPPVT